MICVAVSCFIIHRSTLSHPLPALLLRRADGLAVLDTKELYENSVCFQKANT